jgi:capsular polysaccharide biosynthesis protein
MKRLAKWTMRLYPARWRRRYGDELDALLTESGADARVVADLFQGGVRMQFSTWSFAKLAVVLGLAGLLLGAAGSFLIAPIYQSRAVLELTSLSDEPATTQLNALIGRTAPLVLSRSSLAGIINAPQLNLYRNERRTTPFEDVIEGMKNDIRVDFLPSAQLKNAAFQISFQYPDPAKARLTTATLVQHFVDESLQQRLHEAAGTHYLDVIDPASLPVLPVFPNERVLLAIGCFLGALTAFAWRRLRRRSMATWGFAVQVVVFGFAGLIAANVAFVFGAEGDLDPLGLRFRSIATMVAQNASAQQIQALSNDATSRTSLSAIVNDPRLNLYKEQRKTQPLEDVLQNMRRNLAITPSGQYFTISFEYSDKYKAQQTVNAVANKLDETYGRNYGSLPDEPVQPAPGVLKVIDQASTPVLPISPNRYAVAAKGCVAGLLAAAVIATIRRRWKPEEDLPMDAVNG